MKNKKIIQIGSIAAVALIFIYLMTLFGSDTRNFKEVDTSVAIAQLDAGNVKEAQIDDREQRLRLTLNNGIEDEGQENVTEIMTQYPARTSPEIFNKVEAANPEKFTTNVTQDSVLLSMLGYILPMLIIFGLLIWFFSRMQGGGMGMFGFGGSRAKELNKDMPTNTFADVAGADEAVDELHEIKDFLQDPSRYEELGAKIPRGVLLYGPPGTGKTLLARAVAGEAGVPFYSISGSDFVEMFVGVGASRVRDLFKQARENSPCIIFVDEIDAVGRQRGSGMGGGHDEREQTLNQLLVEMDGFGDREGVILMAATNRPDILDPALLRPGRFDRQIPVGNPDLKGREKILEVHAKGKPLAKDADLKALARRTAGMSGADLANVLNEAALLTARIGGNVITGDALEEATDRVVGGPRRSSKVISEKEKKVTAYHEGGHTLAAWALENIERVHKVTILARGKTGGHAMTAPEDDKGMYNRDELYARLVFAMGGRAAEEVVFGEPTTGASADIEMATKIAKAMLTEYGMSPSLGMVKYGDEQGDPFSGRGSNGTLEYSPATAAKIDEEMKYLLDKAHEEAYTILSENRDYLDKLAEKLLEKETLRRPDLEALFDGLDPRPVGDVFPNEDARFPRQAGREPVKTPTELAIERGEEPPKPFSLLEASKAARAKREAELAKKNQGLSPVAPEQGPKKPDEGNKHKELRGLGNMDSPEIVKIDEQDNSTKQSSSKAPRQYGGTPPPSDWTAPGWPPAKDTKPAAPAGFGTETHGENPYAKGADSEHPGMKAYGEDSEIQAQDNSEEKTEVVEEIGFRLPEHERVENPWNDGEDNKEEAPAEDAPEVADPAPEGLDAPEQQLPEDPAAEPDTEPGGKHRALGGWNNDETSILPKIGDDDKKEN